MGKKVKEMIHRVNKYRNRKVEYQGMTFDSKKECHRYLALKNDESNGKIADLRRQIRIGIDIGGRHICYYIADFGYYDTSRMNYVYEDVKSPITAKDPVYRIKKKLLKATQNIEIQEII